MYFNTNLSESSLIILESLTKLTLAVSFNFGIEISRMGTNLPFPMNIA